MDFEDLIPIIGIIVSGLIAFLKKDEKKNEKQKGKKKNLSVNKAQPIKVVKEKKKDLPKEKEIIEEIKEETKEQIKEVHILDEQEIMPKESKKDEIQMSEIGKENFIFSQDDLVKGIILSEILNKPKALRKKL